MCKLVLFSTFVLLGTMFLTPLVSAEDRTPPTFDEFLNKHEKINERYQNASEEQKERIENRFNKRVERLANMTPEERQAARERMKERREKYRNMTPEERKEARKNFRENRNERRQNR